MLEITKENANQTFGQIMDQTDIFSKTVQFIRNGIKIFWFPIPSDLREILREINYLGPDDAGCLHVNFSMPNEKRIGISSYSTFLSAPRSLRAREVTYRLLTILTKDSGIKIFIAESLTIEDIKNLNKVAILRRPQGSSDQEFSFPDEATRWT